ncbi:MAG: signal peptidase II [Anaerolineales bacterium]|nr:signal peptidase II [Anaerolineales bacterium]
MFKRLLNHSLVFWIAGLVILIDQYAKYLVRANLAVGEIYVPAPGWEPYFRLVHIENSGAAFGIFQNGGLVFTVVAIVVSLVISYYATRLPEGQWALRATLGLQLGGALGNLVDRLVNGPVTDFFQLVSALNTPIFNVADLSITTGVVVLVLMMLGESRGRQPQAAPPSPESPAGPAA